MRDSFNSGLINQYTYHQAQEEALQENQNRMQECHSWNEQHSEYGYKIPILLTPEDILRKKGYL